MAKRGRKKSTTAADTQGMLPRVAKPPKFDRDRHFDEVLAHPKARFFQDGHYFSIKGRYVGSEPTMIPKEGVPKPPESSGKQEHDRKEKGPAAPKNAPAVPSEVQEARKEDKAALAAEENHGE